MTGNQKMFTTMAASAFAVVLLFSTPTTASATTTNLTAGQTINLGTLIDNSLGVQIGDKLFQDFFFSYIDNNTNSLDNLTRNNVVLTALANDIGFGVSFQQPLLAIGADYKDVVFKYSVTVTDPNFHISDIHLSITGGANNGGFGSVAEDVFTDGFGGANKVGDLDAYLSGPTTVGANIVPVVDKLYVQKDVIVTGNGNPNGSANITIIDQTFSQVPEPSTLLLVGLGLLSAVGLKRTRKS